MVSEKYSRFDVTEVTYKIVNDQGIKAYILIPKDIIPGNYPVVAKFHGGGYVSFS
jgi:cephalosporin-C deacetylase-like acetyl esterase